MSSPGALPPTNSGRRPRLLVVTTVYNMIRDFLLPYAAHYRERGWRVDALAQEDDTYARCAPAFDHAWRIGWSRHLGELRDVRRTLAEVRDVVDRESYDIVHVHTPIAGLMTRFALRERRRRGAPQVIYTAHGFHFQSVRTRRQNAPFLAAEKLAGRWTDFLVVINEEDEQAALRHRLVPADRVLHMPGIGIDTDFFSPDRVPAADVEWSRADLGLAPSDQLVLMIAEFTMNKRHADAVRAFHRLGRSDVHLAIAGREGPALEPTRRLVVELGLTSQVHFLGYRGDLPALIRASTATLLVSGREGLPRSVLESLSLATPVVGTRIRGIVDLVADERFLVEVGDVEAIARALGWLLEHPEEARASGERSRARVHDHDVRQVIAMHDALYARALAAGGRPTG